MQKRNLATLLVLALSGCPKHETPSTQEDYFQEYLIRSPDGSIAQNIPKGGWQQAIVEFQGTETEILFAAYACRTITTNSLASRSPDVSSFNIFDVTVMKQYCKGQTVHECEEALIALAEKACGTPHYDRKAGFYPVYAAKVERYLEGECR